jgi:hypothetical protein
MVKVDFPKPDFKIKEEDGKELIFDELRKQWIRLTPEEWVRQSIIQYLIQIENYPAALIGVEKEIKLGELKKRFDVLVFDKEHQPWMMIECKAMDVKLNDEVLQQVLRYNQSIPVHYLVITNGSYTYCFRRTGKELETMNQFPSMQ